MGYNEAGRSRTVSSAHVQPAGPASLRCPAVFPSQPERLKCPFWTCPSKVFQAENGHNLSPISHKMANDIEQEPTNI